MRIRAFKALRPSVDKVQQIASLPYDVVSTEEARQLACDNPVSMLHVVRAEIDLPPGTNPYADEVYNKAVENFTNLIDSEALIREESESVYLYQQTMGDHTQTGLVAVCPIEDYENKRIKKHEKTRPDKENDRTRLTSDLSANSGPVFLTYRDEPAINSLVDEIIKTPPLYDFVADDGIGHKAWRAPNPEPLIEAFSSVSCTYVADGHHRSASAARVGRERQEENPNHTGNEDYNSFLCVLFPAPQLKVLPYNRIIHGLNQHSNSSFLEAVEMSFTVSKTKDATPARKGDIHMYFDETWYRLTPKEIDPDHPVDSLDASILQNQLLAPILGIDDPRTSKRIDFVGGIRGTEYLKQQINQGKGAVAFSLHPVSVEELMAIADADMIMPPKSTWFEPKLRSGLFIHTFEKSVSLANS